jgi:hypothetical protein
MMWLTNACSQSEVTVNQTLVVGVSPAKQAMIIRKRKTPNKGICRNCLGDIVYLLVACAIILLAGDSVARVMAEGKEAETADGGDAENEEGTLVAEWKIRELRGSNVECSFSQNQTTINTTIESIRSNPIPSPTGPPMLCCPSAALSSKFINNGLRPQFFAAADFVSLPLPRPATMSTLSSFLCTTIATINVATIPLEPILLRFLTLSLATLIY